MSLEDLLKRVTEAGFTPGPWRAEKRDRWQVQAEHRGPGSNFCVASINHWSDDAEADARLIAAAPALFEALVQLLDDMGEDGLSVCKAAKDQARNALLRALISQKEGVE